MPLTPEQATDVGYEILGRSEIGLTQAIEALIEMREFCNDAYADGNIDDGDTAEEMKDGATQIAASASAVLSDVMAYHRGMRKLAEAKDVQITKPYAHMPTRRIQTRSGGGGR